MTRKRALMACPNYWTSPFQVGSHHIARGLVKAGWDVAFISDPISPWHLIRGVTTGLRQRFAIYQTDGRRELDGRLWTYVPAAPATPHRWPILRSETVHRHWHQFTCPSVVRLVRERDFGSVDLLYIDSVHQSFWLDVLDYRQAVYRVADYNPQYEKYTAATRVMEREMARRVDLVVYPSPQLGAYAASLGARRCMHLPNGVDFDHFARGPLPPPPEYLTMPRPIAVYLGVIPSWFAFDWIRQAAEQLPDSSFVLIGPNGLARRELSGLTNVHPLGCRDYAAAPAYLQHADVGLMPFDVSRDPRAVDALNPQKLYAYLAAGLPVVSAEWEAIRCLGSPARLCATADDFVAALRAAATHPGDADAHRRYAAPFDWGGRVGLLLEALARIAERRWPLPSQAA